MSRKLLIAEGDSWFRLPQVTILTKLRNKFNVKDVASPGDTLKDMVRDSLEKSSWSEWRDLVRGLQKIPKPWAILSSAGGNDLVEKLALKVNQGGILNPKQDQAGTPAIHNGNLHKLLCELRGNYIDLLKFMTKVCNKEFGLNPRKPIPILIHGYAHPVPDGEAFFRILNLGWGPWLKPAFERKNYTDQKENTKIMADLVDSFNKMLSELPDHPELKHVHYVDLRPCLKNDPSKYKTYWRDELHPSATGARIIAEKFTSTLSKI